jgi:DNA-binding MarR family transcriptional regulator
MRREMKSDPPLRDADYRALAAFRYALRQFLRFSENAARAAGLTPAQHQLLLAVRGFDGPNAPTVADVAERLQLRHHSAGELVKRAVALGLLRQTIDARDARVRRLELTARGGRTLEALTRLHRRELARFRTELSPLLARARSARSRP